MPIQANPATGEAADRQTRPEGLKAAPSWSQSREAVGQALNSLAISDGDGRRLSPDEAFSRLLRQGADLRAANGTMFLIGNGASASLASHLAVDLMKNAGLKTMVFSDPALLTAMSNDYSYDEAFAAPLKACLAPGDMLVAISSSGASKNIVQAAYLARRAGIRVVTLTAMRPDNPLRGLGTLNFYLNADTYGLAESCHGVILHHWIDLAALAARCDRL